MKKLLTCLTIMLLLVGISSMAYAKTQGGETGCGPGLIPSPPPAVQEGGEVGFRPMD